MEVIVILVLVSFALVVCAILLLLARVHAGDLDHGDRLSLLPLETDEAQDAEIGKTGSPPGGRR